MAETDEQGAVTRLVGHFARSNDQYKLLQQDPRAVMLVLGTNGYISVSWMQDKSQAPSWNYASAQFFVDVEFFAEAEPLQKHLREFSDAMEAVTARAPDSIPWDVDQMGPRYASLSRGVIGFSARVREVRARFKLGQDERDDVFRDIIGGLEYSSATGLQALMKDFNPGR
jgi:predicted FMN-binding regulatory protein PaiB